MDYFNLVVSSLVSFFNLVLFLKHVLFVVVIESITVLCGMIHSIVNSIHLGLSFDH